MSSMVQPALCTTSHEQISVFPPSLFKSSSRKVNVWMMYLSFRYCFMNNMAEWNISFCFMVEFEYVWTSDLSNRFFFWTFQCSFLDMWVLLFLLLLMIDIWKHKTSLLNPPSLLKPQALSSFSLLSLLTLKGHFHLNKASPKEHQLVAMSNIFITLLCKLTVCCTMGANSNLHCDLSPD